MKRSVIETILGAVVLFIAGFFLVFSYNTANVKKVTGYELVADFSGIGGLSVGDDVQISGVKVGNVSAVELDGETFLARVHMSINNDIKVPDDTAALISSTSLLGGRYLALEPGASEEMLGNLGKIQFTQAPQNLEQLLGQFIFSMQGDKKQEGADGEKQSSAAPKAEPAASSYSSEEEDAYDNGAPQP